jgi:hypothetical protein
MEATMTREEFETALDRYGGDLSRWPPAVRTEAEKLTASDLQAAAALRAAQKLDALVTEIAAPTPADAALIGRIVSHNHSRHRDIELRPTRRLAGWASAAAALMLIAGFAAGAVVAPDTSNDAIAALLFSDESEDYSGEFL